MASDKKVKLGSFVIDEHGVLHGNICGLGMGTTSVISEEALSKEGRRYLKLIADPLRDGYEVGAAFPKQKDGMDYYSVSIDSPILPAPINAALFPDRENELGFNLVWNRPEVPTLSAEAMATVNQEQDKRQRYKGIKP